MTAKGQKYEFFTETKDEMLRWFTKIKKYSILMHLAHEYNISLLLGKGNYAKVHLAKNISTSKQYAIKSIEKAKMAESSRNMVYIYIYIGIYLNIYIEINYNRNRTT